MIRDAIGSTQKAFNTIHAILAFIFWLALGFILQNKNVGGYLFEGDVIVAGIIVAIIRMITILNNPYLIILEECHQIQNQIDNMKVEDNSDKITALSEKLNNIENEIKSISKISEKSADVLGNVKKEVETKRTENGEIKYQFITRNGRSFAVNPEKPETLLCPHCFKFVSSETYSSCEHCGESLMN